jgi:hypothetical protein
MYWVPYVPLVDIGTGPQSHRGPIAHDTAHNLPYTALKGTISCSGRRELKAVPLSNSLHAVRKLTVAQLRNGRSITVGIIGFRDLAHRLNSKC